MRDRVVERGSVPRPYAKRHVVGVDLARIQTAKRAVHLG
jgi:hypothetical protein